ncbi:MAG: methyltransferase domain-containing protein [Gammaproteobacteria bacterium]|nr:methyltransferase domain-containing protein [Gammaproteobacteria bacterium]
MLAEAQAANTEALDSDDPRGWFARYPRFLSSSRTDVRGRRMAYRHRALIERHASILDGARVLDLASHDGRWSFAALQAGARHVTGIEAKPELLQRAHANLQAYSVPASRYHFVQGDCLRTLRDLRPGQFDCVLCFGFLYHTLSHFDLLQAIATLGARHLILDTLLLDDPNASVRLAFDDPAQEGAALATSNADGRALVGIPSRHALQVMLTHLGFELADIDWRKIATSGWDGVQDYYKGRRHSLLATRCQPLASAPRSITSGPDTALLESVPAAQVGDRTLSLAEVLRHARTRGDTGFVEHAIGHALIVSAAERAGIEVNDAERERLKLQYLASPQGRAYQASTADSAELDTQLDDCLRFGKLKGQVVGDRVRTFFEQGRGDLDEVWLAQIVVADEQQAMKVWTGLLAGEDFEAAARRCSLDEDSAVGGGFIGRRRFADIAPELVERIRATEVGELVAPQSHADVWWLFKVLRKRPARLDARTRSELHLALFERWLEAERERTRVEIPLWSMV